MLDRLEVNVLMQREEIDWSVSVRWNPVSVIVHLVIARNTKDIVHIKTL
jgi:hypothetical protein